jgi:E1A/CREB-binding protein
MHSENAKFILLPDCDKVNCVLCCAASVDMGGSGSFYGTGSSTLTTANNQNMGAANYQSRSRMNSMLLTNQLNMQSIQAQPQIKSEVLDQSEKLNCQSSQLTQEQLLRQ